MAIGWHNMDDAMQSTHLFKNNFAGMSSGQALIHVPPEAVSVIPDVTLHGGTLAMSSCREQSLLEYLEDFGSDPGAIDEPAFLRAIGAYPVPPGAARKATVGVSKLTPGWLR